MVNPSPLRVLHVYSGNLYGGIETFLRALAEERGQCPEMQPEFALCFEGRIADEIRASGAPLHTETVKSVMKRPLLVSGRNIWSTRELKSRRFARRNRHSIELL